LVSAVNDPGTPESFGPDIGMLRAKHPGWLITSAWASRASGPDARQVAARREGVELRAWNAGELSAKIIDAERLHGWDS
jgi:hypothetical protein